MAKNTRMCAFCAHFNGRNRLKNQDKIIIVILDNLRLAIWALNTTLTSNFWLETFQNNQGALYKNVHSVVYREI